MNEQIEQLLTQDIVRPETQWLLFAGVDTDDPTWHEPDCAGVTAKVTGRKLDNAMGDRVEGDFHHGTRSEELRVHILHNGGEVCSLNLATLLAIAQDAVKERLARL